MRRLIPSKQQIMASFTGTTPEVWMMKGQGSIVAKKTTRVLLACGTLLIFEKDSPKLQLLMAEIARALIPIMEKHADLRDLDQACGANPSRAPPVCPISDGGESSCG